MLATSATEHPDALPTLERLRRAGHDARILDARSGGRQRPEYHHVAGGIPHRLVDVGKQMNWLLTYPAASVKRVERLHAAGLKVVYALPDDRWLTALPEVWAAADAVLRPTEWLAEQYRERCGALPVAAVAPAVTASHVVPEVAGRECLTLVDPTVDSGIYFMLRLCEELGLRRPDLPVLVIASSHAAANRAHAMVKVGLAAGFDLRRHENLLFADPAPSPLVH